MAKTIRPSTLYFGVSIVLLIVAVATELLHVSAAAVLVMFSLLSALYGMEVERVNTSPRRKIVLWMVAVFISGMVFMPILKP